MVAIVIDLNRFVNLNILIIYNSIFKIFKILISILKSLIRLFYGKKYNTLRKRIDFENFENFEVDAVIDLFVFVFVVAVAVVVMIVVVVVTVAIAVQQLRTFYVVCV